MSFEIFVWMHLPGEVEPVLAGRASVQAGGADPRIGTFVYSRNYLQLASALPVDPIALPLETREFETAMLQGCHAALLDAGPDAWGRRIIELRHGPQDEFGYLLLTNGGQTGALSFSTAPAVLPTERPMQANFNAMERLCIAAEHLEKGLDVDAGMMDILEAGSSAGGARPKFGVEHKQRLWLAKLESAADANRLINNPLLEAATLALANLAGITTPAFELHSIGNRKVLLVERFDRVRTDQGWARLRYASARTVFHSNPELQRWSHAGSYGRLAKEMGRWSGMPETDRAEIFRRMVFNCLVSNTDDHDLNHGMIADVGRGQQFSLSPAFDMVPQPSGTIRRMHKLIIGDQGALSSRTNVLSVAPVFGYSTAQAAQVVDQVRSTVRSHWESCLRKYGASKKMVSALSTTFDGRWFDGVGA